VKCFKGCTREQIIEALGLAKEDLWLNALTVAELARMKGFTPEYLINLGVWDIPGAVQINYKNRDGSPAGRHQVRRKGDPRFVWTDGKAPTEAYGLWRLDEARAQDRLFFVEGASDVWAGWLHGLPMLGLPGSSQAEKIKAKDLKDIGALYIVKEPDEAGDKFVAGIAKRLRKIKYKGLATVIDLDEIKDVCDLHQRYPTVEFFEMGPLMQSLTASGVQRRHLARSIVARR
jgi:hypothetical protein